MSEAGTWQVPPSPLLPWRRGITGIVGYRSGEPWELPPTAADALQEFCLVVLRETVRELQNTNEQGEKSPGARDACV